MAKAASGGRIFVARQSFSMTYDGQPINVVAGITRVREGHPLLAGDRAQFFDPLEVHYELEDTTSDKRAAPTVTTATATSSGSGEGQNVPPITTGNGTENDVEPTEPTLADRINAVTGHAEANEIGKELGVEFAEKKPSVDAKKAVLLGVAAERAGETPPEAA